LEPDSHLIHIANINLSLQTAGRRILSQSIYCAIDAQLQDAITADTKAPYRRSTSLGLNASARAKPRDNIAGETDVAKR
jgi:hypothetical protein